MDRLRQKNRENKKLVAFLQKEPHLPTESNVSVSQEGILQNEDYIKLETSLQHYENEVRNHIKIEQQLKLYVDGLQSKLDKEVEDRKE